MEQLLLDLLQQLIHVLVVVGLGFLSAYLHKKIGIEKLKKIKSEIESKQEIVDLVVLFTQEAYKKLNGDDKFREAYKVASRKLKEAGFKIEANDLEILIDSSVKKFKRTFGEEWKEI
jgi:hypothetical protein